MNARCGRPDMQLLLLENARGSGVLTRENMQHLESCAACQLAAERVRRMSEVWTADQVDELAIARAAARFHARPETDARPAWFDVVPFASAGVLAGCALLVATGAVSLPWKSGETSDTHTQRRTAIATSSPSPVVTPGVATNGAPRVAPVFASTAEGAKKVRARSHVETRRGVASLVHGMRLALSRGESAKIILDDGRASTVDGPCLVEFWSTPTEVGGWKIIRDESIAPKWVASEGLAPSDVAAGPGTNVDAPSPDVPAAAEAAKDPNANSSVPSGVPSESTPKEAPSKSGSEPAARAAPSSDPQKPSKKNDANAPSEGASALNENIANSDSDGAKTGANLGSARAWARAAVALREDDFGGADRAFEELCRSPDPATRDAARLARAQLWISHGREAAVRPILEQLAQSGATPLIRQRAAEALYH
jgi:hypothetical protein